MSTRRSVQLMDKVSHVVITLGGLGTILAVLFVCVFLIGVVLPLFDSASLETPVTRPRPPIADVSHLRIDEYRVLSAAVDLERGVVAVMRLDDGRVISEHPIGDDVKPTAVATSAGSDVIAFGFEDGTIRVGTIGFETSFLSDDVEVPPEVENLTSGNIAAFDGGLVELTPERQLRLQRFKLELRPPIDIEAESPVAALDVTESEELIVAVYCRDGSLFRAVIEETENFLTGEIEYQADSSRVPFTPTGETPRFVAVSAAGRSVFLAWPDGRMLRFDCRNADAQVLGESIDLTPDGASLTTLVPLIGRSTLLAGDDRGRIGAWFGVKPDADEEGRFLLREPDGSKRERRPTSDGTFFVLGHLLDAGSDSPVTAIATSERSRLIAVGHRDGAVDVFNVTTEELLASQKTAGASTVEALTFAPKENGLVAMDDTSLTSWQFDPGYPEATASTLFTKVWYEGEPEPEHIWQSASGTDDFEPKLGLVPLVFGSLKATFYSLLFGVPIALLAAIYTSEFLSPRHRAKIKPTVEMMASLPSVVLGFFAGLVIAPMVEGYVPQLLAAFITVPLAFVTGAMAWQLLPLEFAMKHENWRFGCMALLIVPGCAAAFPVGEAMESVFFAGDIMQWLDGRIGTGTGGWMFLLFPLATIAMVFAVSRFVNPRIRAVTSGTTRSRAAWIEFAKFLVAVVATLLLSWALSALLSGMGWDPRGSFVDTYVQRNALIVGFIMGFAIIPIIYTIAEDALTTVPNHLRAASLGAGATPWQTAVRIVVPTAMSGLFSAVMIGLGRAVGETMIVLMAAGNTPIMDWNIFNGFRTLSANIAVELPEAIQGSSHYRTLFLAALTLFTMTFVLNTIAESVRQRFRRRAYQL